MVGVAHVDTAKFLDARRSELTVALAKRVAFYAERPAPDLNPQYERRVPADVAAPDQPPPKRTRTEAGVRVRLRFNMSAEEAQDGRDEEGDAS